MSRNALAAGFETTGSEPSIALDLESSRHFPSAVALENTQIGGRHTECACYFVVKASGIAIALDG